MSLLDHFHPPLSEDRPWEGIHSDWASAIARQLNGTLLPKEYVAIPRVHFAGIMEIDVATLETSQAFGGSSSGGTATAVWAPSRPTQEVAVDFLSLDAIEVQIFDESDGRRLAAAIELVSPANKDSPSHREAFAIKCAGYLQQSASLVIVDIVTRRRANLHHELLQLLRILPAPNGPAFHDLYAVAYRALASQEKQRMQIWEEPLAIARNLPTLPLWIGPDLAVPLDLQLSYLDTCRALRIPIETG